MTIYREAKILFDESMNGDKIFANKSRNQTYLLQQGDNLNRNIWEKICNISRTDYQTLYQKLNVTNLLECGESFYQSIIPDVLEKIDDYGYIQDCDGARIIKFDNFTFPLIVTKPRLPNFFRLLVW